MSNRKRMFRAVTMAAVMLGVTVLSLPARAADPVFTETRGFAIKTGYRGVFSWKADQPVSGIVRYGTDPRNLDQVAFATPGAPDTAGIALAEGLTIGSTYYWKVEDDATGASSTIKSFKAANAFNSWDGKTYTLNLLIQLDSQSLPPAIPADLALKNIGTGINVFAERLYDALDGFARLGEVLITDTNLDYAVNAPAAPPGCVPGESNAADVLVQTTVPFDSHTFSGWSIEDPCISFYVGRLGQLVIPWGTNGSAQDLHFGYVSTHEMLHYAFNAPDLYDPNDINDPRRAGCWNLDWDGSLMHNSGQWETDHWELTELDRNPGLTPCDHQHDPTYSWSALRDRYTQVPERPAGPIEHIFDNKARGNADGGALNIHILDREPAASTLTRYIPFDGDVTANPCAAPGLTVLTDAEGDSSTGRDDHDVLSASISEAPELGSGKMQFNIKMAGLRELTPQTTWPLQFKDAAGTNRWVRMATNSLGAVSFASGLGTNPSPFSGGGIGTPADPSSTYTTQGNIHIVVNRSDIGNPSPGSSISGFFTRIRVETGTGGAAVPDNMPDSFAPTGSYKVIGSENCFSNPPSAADDNAATVEDQAVLISVLANDSDPDLDDLEVAEVSPPSNGRADISGTEVLYTPNANFFGDDSFTYVASDGHGGFDTARVNVHVASDPDAPIAFDDTTVLKFGTSLRVPVLANDRDPDGDALTITSVTDPAGGTTQANPDGTIRYTPDLGFTGTDVFDYTISDGALSDTGRVTIVVLPEGADNPCMIPGKTVVTDPAGDTPSSAYDLRTVQIAGILDSLLTFTLKVEGSLNPPPTSSAWRVFFKVPAGTEYYVSMDTLNVLGAPTFTYGTRSGTFVSNIGPIDGGSFSPDGTITLKIAAAKLGVLPGTVLNAISAVSYTFVGAAGTGGFLSVDSNTSTSTFQAAGCLNEPPNDPPAAIDDSASVAEDSAVSIDALVNDTDVNGDPIQVTQFSQGNDGAVEHVGGGVFSYTPNSNFNGQDSFVYTISDGQYSASAIVRVTVTPVNDPPQALSDFAVCPKNGSVTIAVLANDVDVDGDSLTVAQVTSPLKGTVTKNADGTVTYSASKGSKGADSFSYTVTDGNGGQATGTVNLNIAK